MSLAVCSLASGSSGNCYLVQSNNASVLVDAGISKKQIEERLNSLTLNVSDIDAVLLTHEHSDHIKGLKILMRDSIPELYTNPKTAAALEIECDPERLRLFNTGDTFTIKDITVRSFCVSHDAADPCGYAFECEGKKLAIVTDTGYVTDDAFSNMKGADILVLESNHDENILKMGRYPWFLKKRILSDEGHLSNESAANAVARLLEQTGRAPKKLLLAHLSKENNFPEMALCTMQNILEERGLLDRTMSIEILRRDVQSSRFIV